MGILQVICAAGLLLAASGYVSAAGERSGEPLAWKKSGGGLFLGKDDSSNHTWVCHYKNPAGKG